MVDPILTFKCQYPKILTGKQKGKLATNNQIPAWFRFQKTKIKNQFKESLGDWSIPESKLSMDSGTVEFTIYRNTMRRIDADSCSSSAGKWCVDFLVEQGWFSDDDKITFIFRPAILGSETVETMIEVKVYA